MGDDRCDTVDPPVVRPLQQDRVGDVDAGQVHPEVRCECRVLEDVVVVADGSVVAAICGELVAHHLVGASVVVDDPLEVLADDPALHRGPRRPGGQGGERSGVVERTPGRAADHPEVLDVAVLDQVPAVRRVAAEHLGVELLRALSCGPVETSRDAAVQVRGDQVALGGRVASGAAAGQRRPTTVGDRVEVVGERLDALRRQLRGPQRGGGERRHRHRRCREPGAGLRQRPQRRGHSRSCGSSRSSLGHRVSVAPVDPVAGPGKGEKGRWGRPPESSGRQLRASRR